MCGRIACTLDPEVICNACAYYDINDNKYKQPIWREHPMPLKTTPTGSDGEGSKGLSYKYYPSANHTPTMFTPVMIKGVESENSRRVIQPMMWGLIPPWNKGEAKSHGLSTNNARLEGLLASKLYKPSLIHRKLCVIVAQGFYEWKSVGAQPKTTKQPYFIYMPQKDEKVQIYNEDTWTNGKLDENVGWNGPQLLMMAGLYDTWKSPSGDTVYSYAVITMESNSTLSWLHERMPAILDTPEQLEAWISAPPSTSMNELLSILKPVQKIEFYVVSTKVNNSRCRDKDCMNPFSEKESKSKSLMAKWLKRSVKPKEECDEKEEEPPEKKLKVENY